MTTPDIPAPETSAAKADVVTLTPASKFHAPELWTT